MNHLTLETIGLIWKFFLASNCFEVRDKEKTEFREWRKGKSGMGIPSSDQSIWGGEESGWKVGFCAACARDDTHSDFSVPRTGPLFISVPDGFVCMSVEVGSVCNSH